MLVRNLTKVSLPLRKHGQKIVLLPGKVTEVPDVMFTKEQIKNIYGSFVQILNDKLVQEPVVEQTIDIKVETPQVEEAFNETLKKSEEAKEVKEEAPVVEEAPAAPVTEEAKEEIKEEAPVAEEVKEEAPVASDDFEEVCLEGIAELAEEIIEEAKEVQEEKPAKKATKKATAKKTTKKK